MFLYVLENEANSLPFHLRGVMAVRVTEAGHAEKINLLKQK